MCWRMDFVLNAKIDADVLKLERPTIRADKFRELARLDWSIMDMFYYYVEAVDLDGNRELWSPTFVGFLWEYWQRSQLGQHVGISENGLKKLAQDEYLVGLKATMGLQGGLFRRKAVEWPKPIWKPPYVKVDPKVFHILDQPHLPPIPRRMPGSVPYKDGPLEEALASRFEGTEGWDSMVGTSDRLQAAARSMLRSDKLVAETARLRAEAARLKAVELEQYYVEHPEERPPDPDDSDRSERSYHSHHSDFDRTQVKPKQQTQVKAPKKQISGMSSGEEDSEDGAPRAKAKAKGKAKKKQFESAKAKKMASR